MKFNGWANRNGGRGFSFGVYQESTPLPLDENSGLHDMLRQGVEVMETKKDRGIVCGREVHVQTTASGTRILELAGPIATVKIFEKPGKETRSFSLELPFGGSSEKPFANEAI